MDYRRDTRMPWTIAILIVAVICIVAWLGAFLINRSARVEGFGSYKTVIGAQNMDVQIAGDGFVYYDGSSVTRMDSEGKILWSCLISAGAEFNASASGVAAWNGSMLTLIDMERGTTTYSSDQGVKIISARVGSKYAAVLTEEEGASGITVMEKDGRVVYEVELDQLTAVDYGFYSSGAQLWVMALDTTGSVPTCEITTYSPRSMSIVGQISDMEQLMYNVTFQSSSVNCTGVTYYKVYDYNGREIESRRKLVYGWYLISSGKGENPMLAFVPTGQTDGVDKIQDLRMMQAGSDRIVHMPFNCSSVIAHGNKVYGFASDGHIMVASPNSQKVNAYQMPFYIDRVHGITDSGVAVISSGNTLYLLSVDIEE